MNNEKTSKSPRILFSSLHERAKELNCLYQIEEILGDFDQPLDAVFRRIIEAIPPGWQFPDVCQARITCGTETYESPGFKETPHIQGADICIHKNRVGRITISYRKAMPEADAGPFLNGEIKLIQTIAERLGHFILHQRLRNMHQQISGEPRGVDGEKEGWRLALDLLRNTDQNLYVRISRKMMNYLGWRGVGEARELLKRYQADRETESVFGESNVPQQKESLERFVRMSEETFKIASSHLSDEEILSRIRKWINEERSSSAVKTLENVYASLDDVIESIRRIQRLTPEGMQLPTAAANSVRVALIRRFFTEQLEFINIAKKYIGLEDFFDLAGRVVFPPESHGKLGGKSAGLFLANCILQGADGRVEAIGQVKKPKTWYVTSDGLIAFVQYNNLEEVIEQKYKDIEEVRQEYPHLVQVFKNCTFPPGIIKGLSVALDDFGDVPLIVRSSSLLEDRLGTAFAGKYKSLFLANQGDKKARLDALLDAIAEVYASIFSPDPIQYRAERGLLDFYEEMGIMIQAVVGKRVGRYFFPAFAGVAFSRNEFPWSPRIRRDDGLLRLVPGLGTRAVDRLSDDYPILVAPGQPNLRVNVSLDEVIRYSPKKIDAIDLEDNRFVTLEIKDLLKEAGREYPALSKTFSILHEGLLQRPMGLATDLGKAEAVVTFEGLIATTPFVRQMEALLKTLESSLGFPVDVEFASDGSDFYILQCRPQSHSLEESAMEIPSGIPEKSTLFTAKKYVSNGRISDISHIVYVDPDKYGSLGDLQDLAAVGQAVGKLNKLLPRRKFVLLGPGRWGSRGDIKLGVKVTYSEINNAAMLIEVARKKGQYVPEVSFGTHFFQDLVESGIRYLPLYPDDPDVKFNEEFLSSAPNRLAEILPEFAELEDTLRVIDVSAVLKGNLLHILMNGENEQALAYFAEPGAKARVMIEPGLACTLEQDEHSCWRLRMAERIALHCDAKRWGVRALYAFGKTISGGAGPESDLGLVVHFDGHPEHRRELEIWFQGWSLSLAEVNHQRTGVRTKGLLSVRFATDDGISGIESVAALVNVPRNAVQKLPLGK